MRHRISDEEFAEYLAEYESLATEMRTPYAIGRWELEIVSPGGGVVDRQSFFSQSWLRNYVNALCNFTLSVLLDDPSPDWGDGFLNARQLDGTISTTSAARNMNVVAPIDEDTYGILIGSGSTDEDFDDFDLDTRIVNGQGNGEMQHYAVETDEAYQIYSWDGVDKVFRKEFWRYFANFSADENDISIAEVGIAHQRPAPTPLLVVRDVLPSIITVPYLYILRVRYTVESAVFP